MLAGIAIPTSCAFTLSTISTSVKRFLLMSSAPSSSAQTLHQREGPAGGQVRLHQYRAERMVLAGGVEPPLPDPHSGVLPQHFARLVCVAGLEPATTAFLVRYSTT